MQNNLVIVNYEFLDGEPYKVKDSLDAKTR